MSRVKSKYTISPSGKDLNQSEHNNPSNKPSI